MPVLPAFCDSCGNAFPSGFAFENVAELHLSNCQSGPCPKCGGMGHVSDGVFSIVGDTVRILSGSRRTLDELHQFQEILRAARAFRANPDAVVKRVHDEAPSFEALLSLFPANRSDWYAFLAVLLAVVQIYYAANPTNGTVAQPSANQVAEAVLAQDQVNPKPIRPNGMKAVNKTGRNELCPCGSGKKYKKCCGNSAR